MGKKINIFNVLVKYYRQLFSLDLSNLGELFDNDTPRAIMPLADYANEQNDFKVYVMVGVAGAGKDTWIKENVPNLPVLSRDIVRKEIGLQGEKTVGTKAQEELVTKIINERMDDYLSMKQSFVVNNMHIIKKYRDAVKERVRPYGPKLIYVYVEAPTPEVNKIRRNGQIRPEEIDSMYRRLQRPRKDECDELIEWVQHDNPQRVIGELADILCPYCPWTLDEVSKSRVGTCEGSYCDEAYQHFYDTTNIINC